MSDNNPWVVCPDCDGEGKHVLHGIALTADDIEQQGPDFIEDYMNGGYDTVCETCGGRTTIRESEVEEFYERLQDERVRRMESGIYH